jgi:hypothetical protein
MKTTASDAMYEMTFNSDATMVSIVTSNIQNNGSIIQCTTNGAIAGSVKNAPDAIGNFITLDGDPQGPKALEISSAMVPLYRSNVSLAETRNCPGLIVRGWVRTNFSLANAQGLAATYPRMTWGTVPSAFISCPARPKSAMFNITTSPSGALLASTQISHSTYGLPPNVNLTLPLQTTTTNLGGTLNLACHNDTFASDWSNYLLKTFTGSTAFLDARLPPPTFDTAFTLVSETYSRVFATQMSLQSLQLAPAPPNSPSIPAQILTLERRVFVSGIMFRISMAILSLDLLIAILFYSRA